MDLSSWSWFWVQLNSEPLSLGHKPVSKSNYKNIKHFIHVSLLAGEIEWRVAWRTWILCFHDNEMLGCKRIYRKPYFCADEMFPFIPVSTFAFASNSARTMAGTEEFTSEGNKLSEVHHSQLCLSSAKAIITTDVFSFSEGTMSPKKWKLPSFHPLFITEFLHNWVLTPARIPYLILM